MESSMSVNGLVAEYRVLLGKPAKESSKLLEYKPDTIEDVLVQHGEWSPGAAAHLLNLVNNYGSFMLRNALAISLVLGVEDGELGF